LPQPGGVEEIQAEGQWVIPGLWDQHVHLTQWARTQSWLTLTNAESPSHVCRLVGDAVAETNGPVVMGFGYRSALWSNPATVADLDAVSKDKIVVLISGDVHNGWLNSAALAVFGVPPQTGAFTEYNWFPILARLGELPQDESCRTKRGCRSHQKGRTTWGGGDNRPGVSAGMARVAAKNSPGHKPVAGTG
jgi:hypothetical protein